MPAPTSTRAAWKGAISFGLVHIPIALHSATEDTRPSMHMIDKKTNAPISRHAAILQGIRFVTGCDVALIFRRK